MKQILLYVSDHGYGHAARAIALVRNLHLESDCSIIIKNSNSYDFIKSSLLHTRTIKTITDTGPVFDYTSNKVDVKKTFVNISNMILKEKEWIRKEVESIKKYRPDLIVTDISPMALSLANKVKCPALTVGNFSWIDILKRLPNHSKKNHVLEWLKESFSFSEFAIKLPLSMGMEGFSKLKKSSLLCRDLTQTKNQTYRKLGLHDSFVLMYLAKKRIIQNNTHVQFVKMESGKIMINKNATRYVEGQNLVAASNLVITKPGYSILAECIKFRRPVYIIPRSNYPEDDVLCKYMKRLKLAKIFSISDPIKIPDHNQIKEMIESIDDRGIKKIENLPSPTDFILEFIKK